MKVHITALGVFLIGLLGCKSPKGPPEDPLFFSHAPIEVKARVAPELSASTAAAEAVRVPDDPLVRKNVTEY